MPVSRAVRLMSLCVVTPGAAQSGNKINTVAAFPLSSATWEPSWKPLWAFEVTLITQPQQWAFQEARRIE